MFCACHGLNILIFIEARRFADETFKFPAILESENKSDRYAAAVLRVYLMCFIFRSAEIHAINIQITGFLTALFLFTLIEYRFLQIHDLTNASVNWIVLTMISFLLQRFFSTFEICAYVIVTLRCWTCSTSIFSAIATVTMKDYLFYSVDVWSVCVCACF